MTVHTNKAALVQLRDAGEGGAFTVAAAASAEVALEPNCEGVYLRFYASGGDVYLSGGRLGSVTAPTVSGATQGTKIPDGEERDLFIPHKEGQYRIRHIASSGATSLTYKIVSP